VAADWPKMFADYDGAQVVFDRILDALGTDQCATENYQVEARLDSALRAVTGSSGVTGEDIAFCVGENLKLSSIWSLLRGHFLDCLNDYDLRSQTISIERAWAVISDLFDPAPETWGLRGDPFLWLEMAQILCHVPIPDRPEDLARILTAAFQTLTGAEIDSSPDIYVSRFARGGMSSGMIAARYWLETVIPLLQKRAGWLQTAWSG